MISMGVGAPPASIVQLQPKSQHPRSYRSGARTGGQALFGVVALLQFSSNIKMIASCPDPGIGPGQDGAAVN